MTPLITAILFLPITLLDASPILTIRDMASLNHKASVASDQLSTRWSRQDIFTLVSVCVAVVGIFIGALVASPTVRQWLYRPFRQYDVEEYDGKTKQDDGFKNDTKTMLDLMSS
ncbi:hypothetical protein CC77DRAFT_1004638 [Alternaria alternata]|uniref:Uncharacterized protein n=1 Tax=Alternaria alternata TaxID=5599 RepID=A0A177DZ17_ALTAL|nr:hypothetical protein CC77DRAFT_1004638 [Alternaria alternata]OAG24953.1 hypothetical protein CC77DRAFT_1004638 [Alternaria alternata]